MSRKTSLIAAGLIGLTLPLLSPAPLQAMPGGSAFMPVADTAVVPVAGVTVVPAEPRRWRPSQRPAGRYYAPYAYSPAYQYGYAPYDCCELYTIYPAYGRPLPYKPTGPRRYRDYSNSHLRGFYGVAGVYD